MLLKVAEINKKSLTFRKGRRFLEKHFQPAKPCQRAHGDMKFENKS